MDVNFLTSIILSKRTFLTLVTCKCISLKNVFVAMLLYQERRPEEKEKRRIRNHL